MKKSIVTVLGITLSALAAVVTSCTNDEVIASAERHGGKVGFGFSVEQMEGDGAVNTRAAAIVSQVMEGSGDSPVYLTTATTGYINSRISGSSAATKGVSVTTNTFYDNFGLFIYEYNASSDWASAASTATLAKDNEKMLKSNGWITDKYWPGNQKKLTFFAYAPHSTEYTSVSVSNTTGGPTLSYTVPDDVSKQKDLLVTKHSQDHPTQDIEGDKNQVVNMAFYHALTAVQFKIGGTMAPCTIKTITVSGVNSKGTYNFGTNAWTGQNTTATYTISPNISASDKKNTTFTTSENNMLMLLMPQTLPAGAKITITINDGGTTDRTLTLPINGQEWQAGHSVTYTLSTATEDDTYQISVSVTSAPNEAEGDAKYSVTSYRQTYYGTQIPVGWTATYHVDEEENEQSTTGEFVKAFTASTDNPSNTSTDVTATLDKLYFVSYAGSNQKTSNLREKSLVGTDDNHYNLSNSSGAADIQNTANCYIVSAPGYYRIPMVYGNGIKDGRENSASIVNSSTFVNSAGTPINKAKISEMQTINNAVLVWQDAYHLIDPKSVKIKGDFIEFYIPKKYICEGNAVLAARDASNILWSWHIWVTGEEFSSTTNVKVINRSSTTYNFMKLPLGFCHADTRTYPTRKVYVTITQNEGTNNVKKEATATIEQSSATTQSLGVNAPYYQYGRKDPFCPSDGNGNTNKTLYDSQIGFTEFKSQSGAVATQKAIQEPYIFHYVQNADWCSTTYYELWDVGNTNANTGAYDHTTRSSVKSVYDPSPVGYKTPEPAAWTRFTTDGNNCGSDKSNYWNISGSFVKGWNFYTQSDNTGATDFWHALGFRDVYSQRTPTAGTGGLLGVGSNGYYWSCGPSTTATYGRTLGFNSGNVGPQLQNYRAYGFSVRPVSEQ